MAPEITTPPKKHLPLVTERRLFPQKTADLDCSLSDIVMLSCVWSRITGFGVASLKYALCLSVLGSTMSVGVCENCWTTPSTLPY
jgi:hypothetical protein